MLRGGRKPQFYETGRMHPFDPLRIQYLDVEMIKMKTLIFAGSTHPIRCTGSSPEKSFAVFPNRR